MARQTRSATKGATATKNEKSPVKRRTKNQRSSSITVPGVSQKTAIDDADVKNNMASGPTKMTKVSRRRARIRPRKHQAIITRVRSLDAYEADNESAPGDRKFSVEYGHGRALKDYDGAADINLNSPQSSTSKKRKSSASSKEGSPKKVRFDHSSDEMREIIPGRVASIVVPLEQVASIVAEPSEAVVKSAETDMLGYLESREESMSDLSYDEEPQPEDPNLRNEFRPLLDNPDHQLLLSLACESKTLSLSETASLFTLIQSLTEQFAHRFFGRGEGRTVEDEEIIVKGMENFPLHNLKEKFPALYLTTMNILDASTTDGIGHGWLKFFAHPDYRPYLVYGILGEWLVQRIFKDTGFGLAPEGQEEMARDVDQAYIDHDGFVRAKKRSEIVKHWTGPFYHQQAYSEAIFASIEPLAEEILILLAPLLPWYKATDPFGKRLNESETAQRFEVKDGLLTLLGRCADLNLSILRSGENGTIVRFAPRFENGKRFWPTAPVHCINQEMVNATRDDSPDGKDERLVVKMTCWPRIEAYVPHGMDIIEMAQLEEDAMEQFQTQHIERFKSAQDKSITPEALEINYKKFCWECSDFKDYWDELPEELWPAVREHRRKQQNSHDNAERCRQLDLKERQNKRRKEKAIERVTQLHTTGVLDRDGDPEPSDSGSEYSSGASDSSSDSASTTSSDNESVSVHSVPLPPPVRRGTLTDQSRDEDEEPLRGSWVTFYPHLTPHQVYCEWSLLDPARYNEEIALVTGVSTNGQSIRQINGLAATVAKARAKLPLALAVEAKFDDAVTQLWNMYARHNLKIEWSLCSLILLYGASRIGLLSATKYVVVGGWKLSMLTVERVLNVTGVKGLCTLVVNGIKNGNLTQLLATRLLDIKQDLIQAAHLIRQNSDAFYTAIHDMLSSIWETTEHGSEIALNNANNAIHNLLEAVFGESSGKTASSKHLSTAIASAVTTSAASASAAGILPYTTIPSSTSFSKSTVTASTNTNSGFSGSLSDVISRFMSRSDRAGTGTETNFEPVDSTTSRDIVAAKTPEVKTVTAASLDTPAPPTANTCGFWDSMNPFNPTCYSRPKSSSSVHIGSTTDGFPIAVVDTGSQPMSKGAMDTTQQVDEATPRAKGGFLGKWRTKTMTVTSDRPVTVTKTAVTASGTVTVPANGVNKRLSNLQVLSCSGGKAIVDFNGKKVRCKD